VELTLQGESSIFSFEFFVQVFTLSCFFTFFSWFFLFFVVLSKQFAIYKIQVSMRVYNLPIIVSSKLPCTYTWVVICKLVLLLHCLD
jgi:hypothetical protein